jgi:hypothetical protein
MKSWGVYRAWNPPSGGARRHDVSGMSCTDEVFGKDSVSLALYVIDGGYAFGSVATRGRSVRAAIWKPCKVLSSEPPQTGSSCSTAMSPSYPAV